MRYYRLEKVQEGIAIPPGETIRENMLCLGMNQKELALRLGMSAKHLSNIINGKELITYETALKLETVIGPTAQFWMNLETNYQLHKVRLKNKDDVARELELLKRIPYKNMSDHGWVPKTRKGRERLENLYQFFGVASLQSIGPSVQAMLRKQKPIKDVSDFGVFAWLRKAELQGLSVEVGIQPDQASTLRPEVSLLDAAVPRRFLSRDAKVVRCMRCRLGACTSVAENVYLWCDSLAKR
jgi:HTH-type transcriptional regulator/antitoxin HigA